MGGDGRGGEARGKAEGGAEAADGTGTEDAASGEGTTEAMGGEAIDGGSTGTEEGDGVDVMATTLLETKSTKISLRII